MSRTLVKADEYRRLAAEATAQAQASDLDHVRLKHEEAAARWSALAGLEEDRSSALAALEQQRSTALA